MIQISNISLSPQTDFSDLHGLIAKLTGLKKENISHVKMAKRSVDARKKPNITYVCTFVFGTKQEEKVIRKLPKNLQPTLYKKPASLEITKDTSAELPPVVVGSGPAGLFAALILARAGCNPILLERGDDVQTRMQKVNGFWSDGILDEESNVQFGEGGAGTFSDGKLNTGTKDPRNRFVLETFVEHGAPEEILWEARPHVGTDKLTQVVQSMRKEIQMLGGRVCFRHKLTDVLIEKNQVVGVVVSTPKGEQTISCSRLILALGHSARDTFAMLHQKGVQMEQKAFSLGVRIEHPQSLINFSQYGDRYSVPPLPTAEYKLSTHLPDGRGVYTFCMCPGGQVVASASQKGMVCTNGMSNFARDGQNANSGLLVGITPADFENDHPLAGMHLQQKVEKAAFEVAGGNYHAPAQLVGDFLKGQNSKTFGDVHPTYQPGVAFCSLETYLPPAVTQSLRQALPILGQKLKGFDRKDALLTGPETRSSSPVRMPRDEQMQNNLQGLYPCGEGAGYAGGITSAAADGIRVAQAVLSQRK